MRHKIPFWTKTCDSLTLRDGQYSRLSEKTFFRARLQAHLSRTFVTPPLSSHGFPLSDFLTGAEFSKDRRKCTDVSTDREGEGAARRPSVRCA